MLAIDEIPGYMGPTNKVGFGERLHSATKIAALVDALLKEGIAPAEARRGLHLRVNELHLPATRVSMFAEMQ
jgi:hypothetical protein